MAAGIIKKIIKNIPKVVKKGPKKKIKVPLEIKPGKNVGKKDRWGNPIVIKGSPYEHIDELTKPLHRGTGPTGVQKKKLKEAGERISKWFRKQEGKGPVRIQPKLPHLKNGGLISGFPKVAKKGWR